MRCPKTRTPERSAERHWAGCGNDDSRTIPQSSAPVNLEGVRAIRAAKAALPLSGREFDGAQFPAGNVATAIAFLRQCRKTKTARLSRYALKHAAERWGERNGLESYVSNGELIAAAVYLAIKIDWDYGPNAGIGVAVEDVQRLDSDCIWSLRYWERLHRERRKRRRGGRSAFERLRPPRPRRGRKAKALGCASSSTES
jgi:hypothetical protein